MSPSVAGILVCLLLIAFTSCMRWGLIAALLASTAFGATAIGTLTALGGSSPQIYTIFCAVLIASSALRTRIWRQIGLLLARVRWVWVVLALAVYALVGAVLFPRLFAGQTSVFIASHTGEGIYQTALAPTSSNITQSGYFVLGCLPASPCASPSTARPTCGS